MNTSETPRNAIFIELSENYAKQLVRVFHITYAKLMKILHDPPHCRGLEIMRFPNIPVPSPHFSHDMRSLYSTRSVRFNARHTAELAVAPGECQSVPHAFGCRIVCSLSLRSGVCSIVARQIFLPATGVRMLTAGEAWFCLVLFARQRRVCAPERVFVSTRSCGQSFRERVLVLVLA